MSSAAELIGSLTSAPCHATPSSQVEDSFNAGSFVNDVLKDSFEQECTFLPKTPEEGVEENEQPPPFAGFMTASNKKVAISEKALRETRNIFKDDDVLPPQTSISMPSEQPLSDVKPVFNGFMTASNKKVNVSEKALQESRSILEKKTVESERAPSPVEPCEVKPTVFQGFMTASNKKVNVSEKALQESRSILEKKTAESERPHPSVVDPCEVKPTVFQGFMTASNKKVEVSEKALHESRSILEKKTVENERPSSSIVEPCEEKPTVFQGFMTASNKKVEVSDSALQEARRKLFEGDDTNPHQTAATPSSVGEAGEAPVGFMTASNKPIQISEAAMQKARKRLGLDDENDEPAVKSKTSRAGDSSAQPPMGFTSASGRSISVSEVALSRARSLFKEEPGEKEGEHGQEQQPITSPAVFCSPMTRTVDSKVRGFVSPMMRAVDNLSLNSPVNMPAGTASPITSLPRKSMRNRFVTPFKKPTFVSPCAAGEAVKTPTGPSKTIESPRTGGFVCPSPRSLPEFQSTEKPSPSNWAHSLQNTPSTSKSAPTAEATAGCLSRTDTTPRRSANELPARLLPVAVLPKHVGSSVDLDGIILNVSCASPCSSSSRLSIEVGDGSGSSVTCDVFKRGSIEGLEKGRTVGIRRGFVRSYRGVVTVVINERSSIEVLDGPAVEQLKTVDAGSMKSISDPFVYRNLLCVGRLGDKHAHGAIVKGCLHNLKMDKITYFGCASCKRKVSTSPNKDPFCERCRTCDARNYYVLNAELCDFSGSLPVTIFDAVAARLLGEEADEAAKWVKYHPEKVNKMLMNLEFGPPMLFRISSRDEKWTVDDYKEIDYTTFLPFLQKIVDDKGLTSGTSDSTDSTA